MRFDFWNNPLVVSAMRQRYRHGSPGLMASVYLLVLVCVAAGLHHYQDELAIPWMRAYLVGVMGVQFVISGLFAVLSTSMSMSAEVTNRTLDFQRIAALSPRQILLGKILGEPSSTYLLAITTVPLAVVSCVWGAASLTVMFLLYVNLITTSLMLASLGVVRPLEPSEPKSFWGQRNQGSGLGMVFIMFMFLPYLMINTGFPTGDGPLAAVFGCLTPFLSMYGLALGDAWTHGFTFWGVKLPYLCVTPVVQLTVAAVFFEGMAQKLKCPLDPLLSKRQVYALLIVLDVVAAGVLYGHVTLDGLASMSAQFCLFHLIAGLILITIVTPLWLVSNGWRTEREYRVRVVCGSYCRTAGASGIHLLDDPAGAYRARLRATGHPVSQHNPGFPVCRLDSQPSQSLARRAPGGDIRIRFCAFLVVAASTN